MQDLPPDPGTAVYRVKCGTDKEREDYTFESGNGTWTSDRDYVEGAPYGAVGGHTGPRIWEIPFFNSRTPEIFRRERFGMKSYIFKVEPGTYNLRLYFSESFESNYKPGLRVFDVSVEGNVVLKDFDAFAEGGGFARAVVMEVRGVRATDGKLNIGFHPKKENPAICGIEVFRAADGTPAAVQKLTAPVPTPEFGALRPNVKTERALFVGNSFFIFWAMPETISAMVNVGQDAVQLETQRCCFGGRRIQWLWEGDPQQTARKEVESGKYGHVVVLVMIEANLSWDQGMEILDRTCAFIRKNNARPILHWADKVPPEEKEKRVADMKRIAAKHQAVLLPVRLSWDEGQHRRAEFCWRNTDGMHPSLHQAYLTACLHYILWTGKSPKGHPQPYVVERGLKIEDEPAAWLQDHAERVMREYAMP